MDCPICLSPISNSCIGSCTHHFCLECLLSYCRRGNSICPICKTDIIEIRRDLEFDRVVGNKSIELDNLMKTIKINFSSLSKKAGISISNNSLNGKRQIGVKIDNLAKDGECIKSLLKKGDIILFINKIPCINHEQTVKIINNIQKSNSNLTFYLL